VVYNWYATDNGKGRRLILRIESLEIDDHILDKIESKHGVSFEEAEEACLSDDMSGEAGRGN